MTTTNMTTKRCFVLFVGWLLNPACSAFTFGPRRTNHRVTRTTRLESVPNSFDVVTSGLVSICRLPRGVTVVPDSSITAAATAAAGSTGSSTTTQPPTPPQLTLYDIENDGACRLVRERLTELDLNFKVVPSTSNSKVFTNPNYKYAVPRETKIPTLHIGTNHETILSGSDTILQYLNDVYGRNNGVVLVQETVVEDEIVDTVEPIQRWLDVVTNGVASLLRWGRGCQVSPAAFDTTTSIELPLILYSYEGNQFCRLVREVLTELDIVYEVQSTGKGSSRRATLAQITGGSTQCPYLVDPNTGEQMSESADIITYLYVKYANYTPPNEGLQFVSDTVLPIIRPVFATLTKLQAGENSPNYKDQMESGRAEIEVEVVSAPVVLYTYSLSPFSSETKTLLDRLNVEYKEISLGKEWIPGLINQGGAQKRAALLSMTGQSSLPHIFVGGKWIGGLFDGEPGLIPSLNTGTFWTLLQAVKSLPDHVGSFE